MEQVYMRPVQCTSMERQQLKCIGTQLMVKCARLLGTSCQAHTNDMQVVL